MKQVLSKITSRLEISMLFRSKIGIKCYNKTINSNLFDYFVVGKIGPIKADNLYIFSDGLTDIHTLLYCRLEDSPHVELMHLLKENKDIDNSNYMKRLSSGTIDYRFPQRRSKHLMENTRNIFKEKIYLVQSGNYQPVKVCKIGGQYFIPDGKHTAALCAILGIAPICVDVSPLIFDSFYWWVYQMMLKEKENYRKHIRFFESAKASLF